MASASSGTAATTAASPPAAATVIAPMPSAVHSTCGSVRRSPKVAPDAHSIRLFGPGEPELTIEKTTSGPSQSMPSTVRGAGARVLYDPSMVAALAGGLEPDLRPGDVVRAWKPRLPGVREVL